MAEYKIVEGTFYDRIDELHEMFSRHWDEVARNKQLMVLNVDKGKYEGLDKSGSLFTLYMYEGDNLIGYSVNIITTHLHYADLTVGMNDLLFIVPEKRNSPSGLRLIKETETRIKEKGVKLMLWHAKQNTSLAKILEAKKYGLHELIFSKEL